MIVISRRNREEILFSCNGTSVTMTAIKPGTKFQFRLPKGVSTYRRDGKICFVLAGHEVTIEVLHASTSRTRVGIIVPEEVHVERGPSIPGKDDTNGSHPEPDSPVGHSTPRVATGYAAASVKETTEKLDHEIVDIQFAGKSITKIRVPKTLDIPGLYKQFETDHAHVSDKLNAFPTSFVGDLVNKHGAEQVNVNEVQATRTLNLKVTTTPPTA